MNKIISCSMTPNGVLYPTTNPANRIDVIFTLVKGEDGLSGRLSWDNKTQAFLYYDMNDAIIVGFTSTDLSSTSHITEQSIANIIEVL